MSFRILSLANFSLASMMYRALACLTCVVLGLGLTASTYAQRGGPPGGGGGPADFLRRLDRNGNGSIDPDEMEGPARGMLERFKREIPQLDLSKPVPISQLTEAMERMRSRYSGGRGDSRSRDQGGSSSSRSRYGAETTPDVETLVPGFGVESMELEPVPGFGEGSELFSVQTNEQDMRYAEDRFRRYDRNNDGYLSKEELSSGRWSEDPLKFDRNRDGRLTKSEMAVRYAQRRLGATGDRGDDRRGDSRGGGSDNGGQKFFTASSSESTSSSSRTSGSSRGGDSGGDDRMKRIVDFMLSRYDQNKNGVLEKSEWSSMRTDPSPGDRNRDGKLDRDELSAFMASRFGGGGDRGGSDRGGRGGSDRGGSDRGRWGGRGGDDDRGGGSRFYGGGGDDESRSGASTASNDERRSYRSPTTMERLEAAGLDEDLPDWFFQNDANSDGQVAMFEFAAAWSDRDAAEFVKFDRNNDGMITAAECVAAVQDGKVRGVMSSGGGARLSASAGSSDSETPSSSSSPGAGGDTEGIPSLYMRYSVGLIKKYDEDNDGMLASSEWTNMSKDVSGADVDGNGKITPAELARFQMPKK